MASRDTRVQFEFSEEMLTMLDVLVVEMGASSRAEVVRRAIRLLDYAMMPGSEVVCRRNGREMTVKVI